MFDIQAVVVEALERAVAKVVNELGAVEQGEPLEVKAVVPRRQRRAVKGVEGVKQAI